MSTTTHTQPAAPAPTGEGPRYRTPPGHRVLHLVIPSETFALIHKAAIDSNMKFTAYMHRFLKEAFPYTTTFNIYGGFCKLLYFSPIGLAARRRSNAHPVPDRHRHRS
ncbi:hypothetical protein BH23PLA1_BH23PLA1_36880 [soil metagenome]